MEEGSDGPGTSGNGQNQSGRKQHLTFRALQQCVVAHVASTADRHVGNFQGLDPMHVVKCLVESTSSLVHCMLMYGMVVQLDAVTINMEGGVATLRVEGYSSPMPLHVGVAEAAAILYASGMEFRRPSTVNAWRNSLKVSTSLQMLDHLHDMCNLQVCRLWRSHCTKYAGHSAMQAANFPKPDIQCCQAMCRIA